MAMPKAKRSILLFARSSAKGIIPVVMRINHQSRVEETNTKSASSESNICRPEHYWKVSFI